MNPTIDEQIAAVDQTIDVYRKSLPYQNDSEMVKRLLAITETLKRYRTQSGDFIKWFHKVIGESRRWTNRCDDAKRIPDMLADKVMELRKHFPDIPED